MRELFALNLCSWQLFVFKNIYERISLSALRFFSKEICNTTKVNLHENKFFFKYNRFSLLFSAHMDVSDTVDKHALYFYQDIQEGIHV